MERVLSKINEEVEFWKSERNQTEGALSPKKKFVIFSTPRTGSTALCNSLTTNGLGDVREYFNEMVLQCYHQSLDGKKMDFSSYVEVAFAHGLNSEGIFGVNILINQFINLLERKVNILGMNFEHIYLLMRRNKLKQAYSLMKSQKTFIFTSDILEEAEEKYGKIEIDADEVHFAICLGKILREEKYIRTVLKSFHVEEIYFEDIIRDSFSSAVKNIIADLESSLEEYISPVASIMSNESDHYVFHKILNKLGLDK